jgi:hypothetical protein
MFSNTKFHTSRSRNRIKAAEAASAHASSRALRTLRVWSNYISLADVADGFERMLLRAIAAGDVSVDEDSFADRLTAELLHWMFRPSLKRLRPLPPRAV